MRVAALYDVHGNLPALEAVLAEIGIEGVDVVLVGGDVVWGPFPHETLERLRGLGDRVRFVRGNTEREIVARDQTCEETPWCADRLSEEEHAFLAALPLTLTLDVDGLGPVLFCHGSPRSDEEPITVASSEERLAGILAGIEERIVVFGHTHAQFEREAVGKRSSTPAASGSPWAGWERTGRSSGRGSSSAARPTTSGRRQSRSGRAVSRARTSTSPGTSSSRRPSRPRSASSRQAERMKSATVSMCGVCGNMSTGRARSSR